MAKKKQPCRVCDYIRSHRGPHRINEDLVNGISISAIMQRTGLGRRALVRHRDEGHMMAGFQKHAHLTKGAKEQLDLMKCAKEIYDMSIRAAKIAIGDEKSKNKEVKPDLRSFGSCISGAAKVVEVLAKVNGDKEDDAPGIDRAIAEMSTRNGKRVL